MNMNFSNFKVEKTANTKVGHAGPLGQTFDFRYKKFISNKKNDAGVKESKEDTFFEVSTKKFDELKLATLGMIQTVDEAGKSYLAVVDNDNAVILKTTGKNEKGTKGKKFKSTIIETALAAQGVIDTSIVGKTQKLELVLVPGSEGVMLGDTIKTYGVYEVVKSNDTSEEADDKAPEETEATPSASIAPEPTPEPEAAATPVAVASPASDDDF
jgi:hypothetical protein